MNTLKVPLKNATSLLLAISGCLSIGLLQAEDIVPSKDQSDDQISVWVDNAQLDLFITQLAQITGRDASIEGELPGQISGRFNDSMAETLGSVGKQFSVLFDMDDDTLRAMPATSRSSATIAMGNVGLDKQVEAELLGNVLPGNNLEIREGEVLVSGHPSYVSRIAKLMISAVANTDTNTTQATAIAEVAEVAPAVTTSIDAAAVQVETPAVSETVLDGAAKQILADAAREVEDTVSSEAPSLAESDSGEIRWVTDIPGYETF